MSLAQRYRRVVAGLGADGRSRVLIDGPLQPMSGSGGLVWRSDAVPADNSGQDDAAAEVAFSFALMNGGGSNFFVVELPVGADPFLHATDTIDYVVMLSGRVTLVVETGEVTLGPGDLVVDRGVVHAWRNDGPEPAVYAVVTLPAAPLGQGRTM